MNPWKTDCEFLLWALFPSLHSSCPTQRVVKLRLLSSSVWGPFQDPVPNCVVGNVLVLPTGESQKLHKLHILANLDLPSLSLNILVNLQLLSLSIHTFDYLNIYPRKILWRYSGTSVPWLKKFISVRKWQRTTSQDRQWTWSLELPVYQHVVRSAIR